MSAGGERLTWSPESGVSNAGILAVGKKECGKLICKYGQPHCLQSAVKKQTNTKKLTEKLKRAHCVCVESRKGLAAHLPAADLTAEGGCDWMISL